MLLFFSLFARLDFLKVIAVNPFLRKSARTTDISVYVYGRKNRASEHDIISRSVWTRIAVDSDDIGRPAFWTDFRGFHECSSLVLENLV